MDMTLLPACPHCKHSLSSSEIAALYSLLRTHKKGGRPRKPTGNRSKPRAYEAMPIIMQVLKSSPQDCFRTSEIKARTRVELADRGYTDKPMATGWGLNYLQQKGFAENVKRGFWQVTDKGLSDPMTEEIGMQITADIEG